MTTGQKPPRDWQIRARTKLFEKWTADTSYLALIAACPGSGKTQFAVNVGDELLRDESIELVLVIVPTTGIQIQWVAEFEKFGIKATKDADNEALRWRQNAGRTMIEDKAAIVVTYSQLARDPQLFAELVKRHKTLLIADEIHHADDDAKFGEAINLVVDGVERSLALSGTPFNTNGGSLALCETKEGVDPDTGKMVRQTLPAFTYSYGEAILEEVCRRVQFVKVSGHANVTYRSLVDRKFFEKVINTARKTDKIGVLLNPEGDFMQQCIREGLTALAAMRDAGDKRAAMLVVAKSIEHGDRLMAAIENNKQEKQEWMQFSNIQGIYNDSENAQKRIKALESDNTDIVVSVRMISEGVDVKRLRVGVYATDWMTRMFFTQFVGRFVRYEVRSPLDQAQHGVIVIPAHPLLLQWCREVEQMILASQIKLVGEDGGPPPERKNEFVSSVSAADELGLIYQGQDIDYDKAVVEMMCQRSPLCKSMAAAAVIQLAKDFGFANSNTGSTPPPINWHKRNTMIVTSIVGHLRYDNDLPDSELYSRVNGRANGHVGIPKVDAMTPDDVLEKRWHFLQQWLVKIVGEQHPDIFNKAS